MTIVETIQEELSEFNKKKVALTEQLRIQFPALFAPLFKENPVVEKFSWHQYTPYFNDGDSCEFCVYNDYIEINGNDDYSSDVKKEVFDQFKQVLQSVPEEFYQELFGDHVEVVVYRNGTVKTTEYEHD